MNNIKKVSTNFNEIVRQQLILKFNDEVPYVKQAIMQAYDELLIGVVTDRKSKTNPLFYKDEFEERLNNFIYVKDRNDDITISIPDMDTFDFSGRLRVLKNIMEGATGIYVEISALDFEQIFNKQPVNIDPIDEYVPKKDTIYIIRYNSKVRQAESNILDKKLVRYPFSNSPPIDILQAGQDYVDNNIDLWLTKAIKTSEDILIQNRGGIYRPWAMK